MNMTRRLLPVLGDQLSFNLASLQGLNTQSGTMLLTEVMEEASHVPHHPKKSALETWLIFARKIRPR